MTGYSEVYSDVASQRRQIAEGRSHLAKPVVGGSAKQQRVAMRRVVRTPEHREYVKAKKEQLSALGTAEAEVSEYESKVKGYEQEGYKVAKTPEGELQFTKTTMKKQVVKPPGSRITWQEKSGPGYVGKIHVVGVKGSNLAGFQKRLAREFPGSHIISVVSYKGKTLYKADTTTKTVSTVDWDKLKTEHPQLDYLLTYSSPGTKHILEKVITSRMPTKVKDVMFQRSVTGAYHSLTDPEKISYAKQYYKFGVPEGKPWSEFKEPDWELKIKDKKLVVATPLTDTSTLFTAMAKEYEKSPGIFGYLRAGTIAYASWFRPETWVAGFKGGAPLSGGVLGVQPRIGYGAAVETLRWEYPITKVKDPFMKWLKVQQPAYENVILPFAGGALLGKAGKIFSASKIVWSPGTKIVLGGTKVVVAGAMSTVIGADIGYTAAMEQHGYLPSGTFAAKLGKYSVQFAFIGAGYKAGAAWKPKPITKVQTLRTETLRIRDPQNPYKEFFIKRPVPSSGDFGVYSTSPVTVKIGAKSYTFNVFSGETTIKGATSRVVGFGSGQYVGDISPDAILSRTYGYSLSGTGQPAIIQGIDLSKTFYGGESTWTSSIGSKIKFFTPGKETETAISFSFGRTKGMRIFDVSHVVKPSIKAKSYFGDPGKFDYKLPTKLIDDVIMPGGLHTDVGFKISLKSPFDVLKVKPITFTDYGTAAFMSSYWKDVAPASRMQPISMPMSMQKLGTIPTVKTMQVNMNINRDIQDQFTVPLSISKSISASLTAQESISDSLTKQLQIQQSMQKTQLKQSTITTPITTTFPPSPPPPKIRWGYLDLPEGKPKKQKKKKPVDELFKGYRYREWKVPTMKQIIGIRM